MSEQNAVFLKTKMYRHVMQGQLVHQANYQEFIYILLTYSTVCASVSACEFVPVSNPSTVLHNSGED